MNKKIKKKEKSKTKHIRQKKKKKTQNQATAQVLRLKVHRDLGRDRRQVLEARQAWEEEEKVMNISKNPPKSPRNPQETLETPQEILRTYSRLLPRVRLLDLLDYLRATGTPAGGAKQILVGSNHRSDNQTSNKMLVRSQGATQVVPLGPFLCLKKPRNHEKSKHRCNDLDCANLVFVMRQKYKIYVVAYKVCKYFRP